MEEDAQQRVTFLLQEIDANICAAHRSATQICSTVRKHHQILRQIHESSQVWRPLFESFAVQPAAAKRPPITPAPPTNSRSRASSPPGSGASEENDNTVRNLNFSDDEGEEEEMEEQVFKTTTLKRLGHESADESMNVSITSDRLPSMARTPYMPSHGPQPTSRANEGVSMISESTNWTPSMSSPPRTNVLKIQSRAAVPPSTPPSAISSIHPSSPNISRDLMKMGAFEFSPPQQKRPRASSIEDSPQRPANSSPRSPVIPRFATVDTDIEETKGDASPIHQSPRKRKRPGSPSQDAHARQTFGSPVRPSSPSTTVSTPNSYTSLRLKYSAPEYTTPKRSRPPEVNPKTVESIKKASEELMKHNDSPVTPTFEMPSPLLRTQLKAMTPHTPLSNRLVGANLDVGSTTQESRIHEYDESFESGEPAPEFQLSLFPSAFQRGIGAVQMSTLYSRFQGTDSNSKPALSVDQLAEALPDYGKERIEILLDTLVSRRLLRPFVVEGTMFWQLAV